MLIPLVCTQCGGKLEVEKTQVVESGDFVIVSSEQTFKCPHCGMKYLPGEKLNHISQQPNISIGSFFVGGSIDGSVVIGNGLVVAQKPHAASPEENQKANTPDPIDPQSKSSTEKRNAPKKAWQFWKK
jgi:predicted RNA-binding Zn-ribbon protein involved in translation (DUF1610 family)